MSADPEDFTPENMAHVIAANAFLHEVTAICDHEFRRVCGRCGDEDGPVEDE
jgi:hypothetical protein